MMRALLAGIAAVTCLPLISPAQVATKGKTPGKVAAKSPISRIEYLLKLEGLGASGPAEASKQVPPGLLEEVFALNEELDEIREAGYALAIQDRLLGVAGISAPILAASGALLAALTIAGPADRCTRDQLEVWVAPLTSATSEISQRLVHRDIQGNSLRER